MNIRKNIKLINKKETALIYVLIIPLFLILFVPALAALLIRGIFGIVKPNKNKETSRRNPPEF